MEPNSFQTQGPTFENATSQPQTLAPKIENRKSKIENLSLILLLILYLASALAYAVLAPLTTGPDELAHYEYVRFIVEHGRLPLNAEERRQASYKSDQPPLYHLLAALPAALIDPNGPPFLKRYNDHPRRQLIERTRHAWGLYNTEDERWPYRAEILRWHSGRWVAILFGAATVAVTFFIARDVFSSLPSPSWGRVGEGVAAPLLEKAGKEAWLLALLAAAVVAFIPRFGLTGSMLNYETTVAFFAALFLWTLIRIVDGRWRIVVDSEEVKRRGGGETKQPATYHARGATHHASRITLPLLLGLFAGLAILTKLSALILLPEIVVAFWLIGRTGKTEGTSFAWLRGVFVALASALVVLSLWFGFALIYFNTIAADGLWTGLLRPLVAADASDATTNRLLNFLTEGQAGFTGAIENLESGPPWEWVRIVFRTFWLVPVETVQPLAPAALVVALALCLLALFGLLRPLVVDRRPPTTDRRQTTPDRPSTPYSLLPALRPYSRLILSLLVLHLLMPFILPLLRYAVTFSLADTAQGRHVLFLAAPAFVILLVWGLSSAANHLFHIPYPISRFLPLLPALFLLIWTAAHLWTMTWAYLPPLPVSTLPQAKAQAAHALDRPLNKFVTLAGYTSQLDPAGRVLRLDLIWQATALSPVDYLTEISLVDAQDKLQAQWLGYSAGGRYPTRAWDVGDIVRDTVWLPVEGLAAGSYQLKLKLIPTSQTYPPEADAAPLVLSEVTLPETALRTFNNSLGFADQAVAAAGYSVWQNGKTLFSPREFRYRETVLVTLSPLLPDQQRTVHIIGPDPARVFAPVREFNDTALFIVGPDWPSGNYHLQVMLTSPTADPQQVNSSNILSVVDRWQRQFSERPLGRRVEANFANQVKLLGYDLGTNRAEPGGGIPLTLYWQGLDWLSNDYTIFTKLIAANPGTTGEAGPHVYGGRDRLPQEGYRTLYWAPGEVVTDPFGVPVEANAPDGVYYLHVGLYQQVGRGAVSLPLVQDGRLADATSVTIGPIKVGGPPPGTTLTTATPQTVLNQPFGDTPNLTLLGYDLQRDNCQLSTANCQLSIRLYWRSEAPLPLDYTTFVHLRNAAGETVAQKDQPPLNGAYPTSLWDPGEIIADTVTIPLPADLPAGTYQLVAGLYDFNTGQRLAIPGSTANEVSLTSVKAP
jgi:4-amino-4-deoxy-L-arabinose transferase-like glycosyltransferase